MCRMRENKYFFLVLFLIVFNIIFISSVSAADFNVKKDGSGDYTTIQACANIAVAGDTCLVYAGTYNERVYPASSGTLINPITYLAQGEVKVRGFSIISKSDIVIEGFELTNEGMSIENIAAIQLDNGSRNIIKNNKIHNTTGNGDGVCIQMLDTSISRKSNNNLIKNNTLYYCASQAQGGGHSGIGIVIYGDNNIIEYNDISRLGDDFTRVLGGERNVIRNNVFHDNVLADWSGSLAHIDGMQNWCSAYNDNLATKYTLIENNLMYNAPSPDSHFVIYQDYGDCGNSDFLVRYNSARDIGDGTQINDVATRNVRLYNNNFIEMGGAQSPNKYDFTMVFSGNSPGGKVINNIFYNALRNGGSSYYVDSSSLTGFYADYNIQYNDGYNGAWASLYSSEKHYAVLRNLDPGYVNKLNNFSLNPNSPAINAGGELTNISILDIGSGNILMVNDSGFFQDGWAGTQPDCIAVGNASNFACIASINYATNTITLSSSITRNDGDAVYLYSDSSGRRVLYGDKPDVGAHEYLNTNLQYHPSDSDLNNILEVNEVRNYIFSYFSANINLNQAIYSLTLLQTGGEYNSIANLDCDINPWNCWVNV